MTKLKKEFFGQKPEIVAKELLGKRLVVISRNQNLEGIIVATSAYFGEPKRKFNCLYADAGELSITTISGYKKLVIGTQNREMPSVITIDKILTEKKKIDSGEICDYFGLSKDDNGKYVFTDAIHISGEKSNFSIEEHHKNASKNCIKRYQLRI